MKEIHISTPDVYREHAAEWDATRYRTFVEQTWLDAFCATIPAQGSVLDVGCGGGEPIARYLIDAGLAVTGIDTSPGMLTLCRSRFPASQWIEMDMRYLDLKCRFDGIIVWDSFFHLAPDEQRQTLLSFSNHLNR